jgi:CopG family nickel-responsive transcriptional regulator
MPIVSLNIPDALMKDLEMMSEIVGYSSRSEAIRDALRTHISEQRMYRRTKEDVFNAVMFLYQDGDNERKRIERLRSQFSKLIQGEVTYNITKERKVTVLLTRGHGDEVKMLTSRIRGIRGIEQTRYIMTDQ